MLKVSIFFSGRGGGIGRYNHEMLKCLSEIEDLDIEYLCSPDCKGNSQINIVSWPHLFRISSKLKIMNRARFLLGEALNLRKAIKRASQRGTQILHLTSLNHLGFPFWCEMMRRSGLRIVLSAHDIRRQVAILHMRYEDEQLRRIYQMADGIFVHSWVQAAELERFASVGCERIHLVPHGPYGYGEVRKSRESVRERYGISSSALLGLFFGQIRDEKNLSGLLEAMVSGDCQSNLLVAGQRASDRHRPCSEYREDVRRLGLEDRVVFDERYIPDGEIADLVNAADWIALPYRSSFTSQSGVLNLAAHYNRPVMVGAAPTLAAEVKNYGIGVAAETDDVAELRKTLRLLEGMISTEDGAKFYFSRYREAHSWARNAEITAEIYRELAACD